MLRLTILLCGTIFVTLLVGGRDFGQARFGLMPPATPAAEPALAAPVVEATRRDTMETGLAMPVVLAAPALLPERPVVLDVPVASAPLAEPAAIKPALPVRYITAAAVNVREGPGTRFAVAGRLTRGEAAAVVLEDSNGWSLIRIEGDGIEGYVSSRYLGDQNPAGN